jgi:large subunit ribosomal protein L3
VDVTGTSKGKGYQGVMKRHGFGGGRKTHGSKFHRAPGSTGMAAWPSRVIKGTKMPGRMGGVRRTVQNLRIVSIDAEQQMLLVSGAVPGTRDGYVIVQASKKKG